MCYPSPRKLNLHLKVRDPQDPDRQWSWVSVKCCGYQKHSFSFIPARLPRHEHAHTHARTHVRTHIPSWKIAWKSEFQSVDGLGKDRRKERSLPALMDEHGIHTLEGSGTDAGRGPQKPPTPTPGYQAASGCLRERGNHAPSTLPSFTAAGA